MTVSLTCVSCRHVQRLPTVVTGAAPACPACGGKLILQIPTAFRCLPCGISSKPAMVDLATARRCPKCRGPLEVAPDPAGASAATIITVPSSPASHADDAPFDPARVEFMSGVHSELDSAPSAAPGRTGPGSGRFGRYEIVRELARGGMGIVYLARDPKLKRPIALKVLIAGEGASDEAIRRFIREARAASALRHANIVTVHDAGEIDGQHFFTMDFVKGRELGAILSAGAEPLPRLLGWVREVCLALHHAHGKGIIHRDLKPANIMIDDEARPLVMDFGLARDQNSRSIQSLSGSVMGTPAYMSPEQAMGRVHELDHRTDIYSMGVIIYELATGSQPFSGDTLFDTMRMVVNDEPLPPLTLRPELGDDLNTIILKCLDKQPDRRYQTMLELADDLGRFLSQQPIAARPLSAGGRLARRIRRDPKLKALLIGAPIACVAGLLAAWLLIGDSFLPRMQAEIRSGDPSRMASAVTAIGGQLSERRLARPSDRERALALMRSVVPGPAAAAEDAAIAALTAQHDAAIVPALLVIASDPGLAEPRRGRALSALRSLADVVADKPEAARALAGILQRDAEPVGVVTAAAGALHAIDAEALFAAIAPVITDPRRPAPVRVAAITAVGEGLRLHSPLMPMLLALQGDRDPTVAMAAERALAGARTRLSVFTIYGLEGRVGDAAQGMAAMQRAHLATQRALEDELASGQDDASPPAKASPAMVIAERLRAKDAAERCAAAYDLGQLHDAAAIPPLLDAVADPDGTVRRSVARALVKLSPLAPVPCDRVRTALGSADPRVREHAALLLGELESRESVGALGDALRADTDEDAAGAAAEALGRIGDEHALPALRDGCDRPAAVALACVQALRARKAFAGDGLPHLVHALESTSRSVREAAAAALREVTGQDLGSDAARWRAWLASRAR